MKKVLITIKGMQNGDAPDEAIEFMTEGVMRKSDNDYILSYGDSKILGETESDAVKTRLTIHGNEKVIIERKGGVNSKLIIEKGKRNDCLYSIPQGDLNLCIFGKTVDNGVTEKGGTVKLTYDAYANTRLLSENVIEIKVKEV